MFKKIFFALSLLLVLALGQVAEAAPIGLTRYAWSSNIGWISFAGSNYQVFLDQTTGTLSGHAWSSNIGWIDFNGTKLDGSTFARAIAPNVDGSSGWDGKIKLAGSNYGVTVDGECLRGFAWGGDVVGWIEFCSGNGGCTVNCGPSGGGGGYGVHIGGPIPPQNGLIVSCTAGMSNADGVWHATIVSGGVAPYKFDWIITDVTQTVFSGHDNPFVISGIADGSYSGVVRVTDKNKKDSTCQTEPLVIENGVVVRDPVYPSLTTIAPQDRVSISSQPLTSPARSSGIGIQADDSTNGAADPLHVKVLDIVSLTTGKSLLKKSDNGGVLDPDSHSNQRLPACYLGATPFTGQPGQDFTDCNSLTALEMAGGDEAYFNIEIYRPVQTLKDNNPYRVTLGDEHGEVSFLFDYRVGTVNPF